MSDWSAIQPSVSGDIYPQRSPAEMGNWRWIVPSALLRKKNIRDIAFGLLMPVMPAPPSSPSIPFQDYAAQACAEGGAVLLMHVGRISDVPGNAPDLAPGAKLWRAHIDMQRIFGNVSLVKMKLASIKYFEPPASVTDSNNWHITRGMRLLYVMRPNFEFVQNHQISGEMVLNVMTSSNFLAEQDVLLRRKSENGYDEPSFDGYIRIVENGCRKAYQGKARQGGREAERPPRPLCPGGSDAGCWGVGFTAVRNPQCRPNDPKAQDTVACLQPQ